MLCKNRLKKDLLQENDFFNNAPGTSEAPNVRVGMFHGVLSSSVCFKIVYRLVLLDNRVSVPFLRTYFACWLSLCGLLALFPTFLSSCYTSCGSNTFSIKLNL